MIIKTKCIKSAITYFGTKVNSPEQRLMLGATALVTQPLIDMCNKSVDKETRKTSVARTLAKVIAGTLVGFAVRKVSISTIKAFSGYLAKSGPADELMSVTRKRKWDIFVPMFESIKEYPKTCREFEKDMVAYRKGMGTLVATVAMIFTNFALDAPLTKYLTDVFGRKINKNFDKAFDDYQEKEAENVS